MRVCPFLSLVTSASLQHGSLPNKIYSISVPQHFVYYSLPNVQLFYFNSTTQQRTTQNKGKVLFKNPQQYQTHLIMNKKSLLNFGK